MAKTNIKYGNMVIHN